LRQEFFVATTRAKLMTFAEFEQLPDPTGARLELHEGAVVSMPPPILRHSIVQQKLRDLLQALCAGVGSTYVELGFRPTTEWEFRYADVAWAPAERWAKQDPSGYFSGAPDIVIEVLSPSNTVSKMFEKEQLCLENGCREFWVVDLERKVVKISTTDGRATTYKAGQGIPLFFAAGAELAVDAIFG
jgi:Uma2 family endonuclease